jgi:hypothetical protein
VRGWSNRGGVARLRLYACWTSAAKAKDEGRTALLWAVLVVAGLALVTGVSALVGWQGAKRPQKFDWVLAATFGTAFGTTALAAGTVVLAWLTKQSVGTGEALVRETKRSVELAGDEVAASRESVVVAARDLETTIRPVLADVPLGEFFQPIHPQSSRDTRVQDRARIEVTPNTGQAGSTCSVPIRNVGAGVAILGDVRAQLPPDTNWYEGQPSVRILPPEGIVRVLFRLAAIPEDQFLVEARYKDVAGGQPTRTRLKVRRVSDNEWQAVGAALYQAEEGSPFVTSGELS